MQHPVDWRPMDATALLQPTRLAVDAGTRGVDGGVTATGVLVRRRGPKKGVFITLY